MNIAVQKPVIFIFFFHYNFHIAIGHDPFSHSPAATLV